MAGQRTLPGTLDALAELPAIIDECAALADLSHRGAVGLRLAVDEIVTNIVIHGYQEHGLSGTIAIDWQLTGDREVTVGIEDTAPAFDPTVYPEPEHVTAPLDERPEGGLGIMLARRGVDEMTYEHKPGRNRVELRTAAHPLHDDQGETA